MGSDLDKLSQEIDQAKKNSSIIKEPEESSPSGNAMRFGIELVSGVAAGAALGYFADEYFGTSPIFFLVFFTLGTLGGFLNIYRLASRQKTDINNVDKN